MNNDQKTKSSTQSTILTILGQIPKSPIKAVEPDNSQELDSNNIEEVFKIFEEDNDKILELKKQDKKPKRTKQTNKESKLKISQNSKEAEQEEIKQEKIEQENKKQKLLNKLLTTHETLLDFKQKTNGLEKGSVKITEDLKKIFANQKEIIETKPKPSSGRGL